MNQHSLLVSVSKLSTNACTHRERTKNCLQ